MKLLIALTSPYACKLRIIVAEKLLDGSDKVFVEWLAWQLEKARRVVVRHPGPRPRHR